MGLRNVSNALGTPSSLPAHSDRFWGDPAGTRHTFDNFSDFRFCNFYMGFASNSLRELLSGSEGAYSSLVGIQTAQYTPPPSFFQKYAFWRFPIFQNQEKSRKSSRKGSYTLLWSLEGLFTTLVDMQTVQDSSVSTFFMTHVRHAFVAVRILLEWEISRKSSGKSYFTAVLGVRIQPRTL